LIAPADSPLKCNAVVVEEYLGQDEAVQAFAWSVVERIFNGLQFLWGDGAEVAARGKYWRTSGFGSSKDGCELFGRARSNKKSILVVEGASHYDLYDKSEYVDQAMKKLEPFYKENL
jgi:hypothetical protein